jgi:serine/threonine-protein kinase
LDDVFEVQSDVAKQVAEALKVRILTNEAERVEKRPTKSTEAYTSYLRGLYLYGKRGSERTEELVKEAAQCFEQAVKEDPGFALAYVGLAGCSRTLYEMGIQIDVNIEKGKRMSAKALELDPGLAEAHSAYGWTLFSDYDFGGAEEEFKKAIQLKPSLASAHNGYYGILELRRQREECIEEIEKAVELDPLLPVLYSNYGWTCYAMGDYRRALELLKRAVDLGRSADRGGVAFMYGKMKMFEDMRREYAAFVELCKGTWAFVEEVARMQIAYLEDDRETLRGLLVQLETHVGESLVNAFSIATGYFRLGENDKGFLWLERSYSRRESGLPAIAVFPDFDGVRTDPRYLDLLKRLGLD